VYVAAPLSLLLGRFFEQVQTTLPFLLIFGITTASFASYDFYPIFPWIGIFFAGYAVGLLVKNNGEKLSSMRTNPFTSAISKLGRVSLIYYLLHQPALFALFFVFDWLRTVALNL